MKTLAIAALFALSVPVLAGDPSPERFAVLVRQLAADDAEMRQAAQEELSALDESWRGRLDEALKAAADPEAAARLREILQGLGRPRWVFTPEKALAEAKRSGRPVVVVCATGTPDTARLAAASRLLSQTLAPAETVKLLRERCVPLWIDLASAAGEGVEQRLGNFCPDTDEGRALVDEGSEEMAVETMVCTASGKVVHAFGGWWSAEFWRAEVEKGLAWAVAGEEKAAAARKESHDAILAEASRLDEEVKAGGGKDPARAHRAESLHTLSRRYAGYSHSKIGRELAPAVEDAVEDFVGREFKCG